MLPPAIPRPCKRWVTPPLAGRGNRSAAHEKNEHNGEQGPTLAVVPHDLAERVGEGGRYGQNEEHLQKVHGRRRVLEGMRGVGVEEAAAVRAEQLNGFLRGDGPERDGLLRALQSSDVPVGVECLQDALRAENQCGGKR